MRKWSLGLVMVVALCGYFSARLEAEETVLANSMSGEKMIPVPRSAIAAKVSGTVEINGVLDEPDWQVVKWNGNFFSASAEHNELTRVAKVETRFKVLYDENAIYVGIQSDEPNLKNMKSNTTSRDGQVYLDDCIEIFFDPENSGQYYHHFIINSNGVVNDGYATDFGLTGSRLWNCAFESQAKSNLAEKIWTVEAKIPFGSIFLGENPKSIWLWNIARERYAGGKQELTTWSPLKGGFHQPKLFGSISGIDVNYRRFRLSLSEPQVRIASGGDGRRILDMRIRIKNETGMLQEIVSTAAVFEEIKSLVKAAPVKLEPNEEVEIAFPKLSVPGNQEKAKVLFSFTDPPRERILKSIVKNLSVEYQPITIKMVRPHYRNNIYASQKLKDIAFKIFLASDIESVADKIRYELSSAQDNRVLETGQFKIEAVPETIKVNIEGLPYGKYALTASVVDVKGSVRAKYETVVRKLPPRGRGNEVRIDENRNILVNDRPFFGLGWYGNIFRHFLKDPRQDVIALCNLQTPVVVRMDPEPDFSKLGELYDRHGIMSIADMQNGRLSFSFRLWRKEKKDLRKIEDEMLKLSTPSEEMVHLVKELVEAVKGEPWLLGYYIADEPELQDTRSDYLENYYKLLQKLDPYHPVFVTNCRIDGITTHGYKNADILNPDPYKQDFDYVPRFVKKVNEVAPIGKSTYVTPWHGSYQALTTAKYGTLPPYPYHVFRNQYFVSIVYGAKGFTPFVADYFIPEVEYYIGLPYVWRELRFLEKAILAQAPYEPLVVETSTEVGKWIRVVDGKIYIIVVNYKPGAKTARISSPLLENVSSLIVMSEGRNVVVRKGVFTDRFEEGDVHIYTTDLKARKFKSTKAITDEIAKTKKKNIKRGNLLHWSRGTRLRAAKGFYSPWAKQYYYYAVNGITIDLGWFAYAWDKKSTWLELILNDESPIGRIVLYTPNIKDYKIALYDGDNWVTVVNVMDNTKDRIEHIIKPKVNCIKMRVTVTAVRDERGPILSEIEAYKN